MRIYVNEELVEQAEYWEVSTTYIEKLNQGKFYLTTDCASQSVRGILLQSLCVALVSALGTSLFCIFC